MKKSAKLLSVLLAVLMILSSVSVLASAKVAAGTQSVVEYGTVADLDDIKAYDAYGRPTRFTTDERISILLDFLDKQVLPGIPFDGLEVHQDFVVIKIDLSIHAHSIDEILASVNSVKTLLDKYGGTVGGDVAALRFDTWDTSLTRKTAANQGQIVKELFELLNANALPLGNILRAGKITLGSLVGGIGAVQNALAGVNKILGDLPSFIKGFIFPLMEKHDDTMTRINFLNNMSTTLTAALNDYVYYMLTHNVSIADYKEDAKTFECNSTMTLPDKSKNLRTYFVVEGTGSAKKIKAISWNKALNGGKGAYDEANPVVYTQQVEKNAEGKATGNLVYVDATGAKLTWYVDGTPALHSLTGLTQADVDLTKKSAADLLYFFIPYVFEDFATVPLNGSLKKEMAWLFGARWGAALTADELAAETAAHPEFKAFTEKAAVPGVFTFSDYAVIDGNHYWRYGNDFYKADLSNTNDFFNLINWNYKIDSNFIKKYVPTSGADNKSVLKQLNRVLFAVVNELLSDKAMVRKDGVDTDVTIKSLWADGDNTNLTKNIRKVGQAIVAYDPASIFGSNYAASDRYYDMIMTDGDSEADYQRILNGIACTAIKLLMPQLKVPTRASFDAENKDLKVGALLTAVVRELATEFVPEKNFDAMIYADYAAQKFLPGKDNAYWLDVMLTIGTDIGFKYLASVVDLGEDNTANFAGAKWQRNAKKDYAAADSKLWEDRVDYLLDWGLSSATEYTWHFEKFFNTTGVTVDMKTKQDPLDKLGKLIGNLVKDSTGKQVLLVNIDTSKPNWLRNLLVNDVILAIGNNVDLTKLTGTDAADGALTVPANSPLRKANVLGELFTMVKDLINNLFYKLCDNTGTADDDPNLIPKTIKTLEGANDGLFTKKGLGDFVQSVLDHPLHAYNHGLLDFVMPFVTLFVGYKSTGQDFATPNLSLKDDAKGGEALVSNNGQLAGTLTITNASAGMLFKHTVGDTTTADNDNNYIVHITNISSDVPLTFSKTKADIMPWTKEEIKITGKYNRDTPVLITVDYNVTGRDGKTIGTPKQALFYTYITNVTVGTTKGAAQWITPNGANSSKGAWLIGVTPTTAVPNYYTVSSVDEAKKIVNNITYTFVNGSNDESWDNAVWVTGEKLTGKDMNVVTIDTSVNHSTSYPGNLNAPGVISRKQNNATWVYDPFTANDAAFAKVTAPAVIDLGNFEVTFHNNTKKPVFGNFQQNGGNNNITVKNQAPKIYLIADNAKLAAAFNQYKKLARTNFPQGAETDALWKAFLTAMSEASKYILAPITNATYETYTAENYQVALDKLNNAVVALNAAGFAKTDATSIKAALTDEVQALDYHDYDLYEFFKFQGNRNDGLWRINAYKQPVAGSELKPYIKSNPNLDYAVIEAAGKDAAYGKAIMNSLTARTQQEIEAQNKVHNDWVAPTYLDLQNDDLANKITFSSKHLKKLATEKQFLAQELDLAKATYDAKNADKAYSTLTYAAFVKAYDAATAINKKADALRHEVFSAKYDLMVAFNGLIPADHSCQDAGYYDNLNSLIAQAEAVFANANLYEVKQGASETAWGDLVTALGYETADGTQLYPNSAKAFVATDRYYSNNEGARIDAQVQNLKKALANFECAVKFAPVDGTATQVNANEFIINGINPASILNEAAFDKFVKTVAPADVTVVRTLESAKAGYFGTGTKAVLKVNDSALATYTLVIYGDVNGDGAVDAFDAALLDRATSDASVLTGANALAGDVAGNDGVFDVADYTAIITAAKGGTAIDQVR